MKKYLPPATQEALDAGGRFFTLPSRIAAQLARREQEQEQDPVEPSDEGESS